MARASYAAQDVTYLKFWSSANSIVWSSPTKSYHSSVWKEERQSEGGRGRKVREWETKENNRKWGKEEEIGSKE